jgi:molybdate transport system substrate-binding protein
MLNVGRKYRLNAPVLVISLVLVGACTAPPDQLSVFAASSLRDVLPEISADCGLEVEYQFGGSQALKLQILHGAPADIFLSANQSHLRHLVDEGFVKEAKPIIGNTLALVLSSHSLARASHIATLMHANRVVVGMRTAPIGNYTQHWLSAVSKMHSPEIVRTIEDKIVSYENNTRLVLQRVLNGDADVGIVYRSDTHGTAAANVQHIPSMEQPTITFYYGATTGSKPPDPDLEAFRTCLQSTRALAKFQHFGFEAL